MGRGDVASESGSGSGSAGAPEAWGEGLERGEVPRGKASAAKFAYAWFGASVAVGAAVGRGVVRGGEGHVGFWSAATLWAALLWAAHAAGGRAMPEGMLQRLVQRRAVAEFATRTMSVVHSTAASVWAGEVLLGAAQPDLFSGPLSAGWSPMVRRALEVSVAYMSVDLGMSVRQAWVGRAEARAGRLRVAEDIVHHVVTIVAQAWALGHACYGAFVALLLLTEITTPILNARWFLSQAQAGPAQLMAVSVALMVGFLLFRCANYVFMAYLVVARWDELGEPVGTAMLVITSLLMGTLNFYWMGLMVRRAREMTRDTSRALTH